MADRRIEKWLRWLRTIEADVERMHLHRMVFLRVDEIVRANPKLPESYFFEYLSDTYAATQSVAVRRQAESADNVQTLGRLLFELEENASLMTRGLWISMWGDDDGVRLGIADRQWDKYFAGEVGDHLDPGIPLRDRETLVDQARKIKRYVDKYLAHADRKPGKFEDPTFDELDAAVDVLGELLARYNGLLTLRSLLQITPELQHDWEAVFRVPWLQSGRS